MIDWGSVMSERVISTHAITPSVIRSPYLIGIFISGQRKSFTQRRKGSQRRRGGSNTRTRPKHLTRLCVFASSAPLREKLFPCRPIVPVRSPRQGQYFHCDVCFRWFETDFLELFCLWIERGFERFCLSLKLRFKSRELLRERFDIILGALDILRLFHRTTDAARRSSRSTECGHARPLST